MSIIDDKNVIRCAVTVKNPISIETLPFLSRVHRTGYRPRKRGLQKRVFGKPAQFLYRKMSAAGLFANGRLRVETGTGAQEVFYDPRNTQFSTLYMPQFKPFYEAEICTVFDRVLGGQDVFFDIGANWGWHSIVMAARESFKGLVHAFEPFPPSFSDLSGMVKQAKLEHRIICHDVAIAAHEGTMSMVMRDGLTSGGAHLHDNGDIKVRLTTIDKLDLPEPKAMKIDVEDHELDVMQGADKTIDKARPFIVFENWMHSGKPNLTFDPLNLLLKKGYSFFYPGWVGKTPDCILEHYAGRDELALVPFLPVHRPHLGDIINVIAVADERMDEFRRYFS